MSTRLSRSAHQLRLEKGVLIRNLQADEALQRRMPREAPAQRAALLLVHDEDEVGPVQHLVVHAGERVRGCPGGADFEIRRAC